jgi:prepilin-type N-terminal cleavage/methylation domain-containing protein
MSNKTNKEQQGFTIVELLIATAVFSVLLIGILSAFIKISDLFYKGVSMTKTQEDARNIVKSISDDIQFFANTPGTVDADFNSQPVPSLRRFCIGSHRYVYDIGTQVNGTNHGLVRDSAGGGGCPPVGSSPGQTPLDLNTALQMLDYGMQLNSISINCSINDRCDVKIHVIYYGGDPNGLLSSSDAAFTNAWQAPDAQCTGSLESTDICATVDYDSTVLDNTP